MVVNTVGQSRWNINFFLFWSFLPEKR